MTHYRKKPVVIQATQWFTHGDHPAVVKRDPENPNDPTSFNVPEGHGWVPTLEGGHIVTPGDWIITGVQGEHYPCKPDIFAATYESVQCDGRDGVTGSGASSEAAKPIASNGSNGPEISAAGMAQGAVGMDACIDAVRDAVSRVTGTIDLPGRSSEYRTGYADAINGAIERIEALRAVPHQPTGERE